MKTIAIPIFGTRVSSRLDCAESVLLVTVDDSTVKKREQVRLVQTNPLEKINMLIQLGVEVVICGGITEICSNKFNDCGMQVIPWVRGEAEEVLSQFLAGKLAKTSSLQ
jgi:predicted Fe-Mo cluster-binding NifX family protein